jgi:hypothetical protein
MWGCEIIFRHRDDEFSYTKKEHLFYLRLQEIVLFYASGITNILNVCVVYIMKSFRAVKLGEHYKRVDTQKELYNFERT